MNALLPWCLLTVMSVSAALLLALNWPDLRRSVANRIAGVRVFFLRSQHS